MVPRPLRPTAAALLLAACGAPSREPAPQPAFVAVSLAPRALLPGGRAVSAPSAAWGESPATGAVSPAAALLADAVLALELHDTASAQSFLAEAARLTAVAPVADRRSTSREGRRNARVVDPAAAGPALPEIPAVETGVVALDTRVTPRVPRLAPERWAATGRVSTAGGPQGVVAESAAGEVARPPAARRP